MNRLLRMLSNVALAIACKVSGGASRSSSLGAFAAG